MAARVIFALTVVTGLSADALAVVMEWVTVGHPGNVGELSGQSAPGGYGPDRICGGVDYVHNIGKYEVTNSQYAEFLNAVATIGDPYGLYNAGMGGGWNNIGGISRTGSGTAGAAWQYEARANRANRPVNYVSWYSTLRFANWMHNGRPSGAQNGWTTEDGAYDMSLGSSVVRKPSALVFLPSEDEWYKAAYYDPDKVGGAGYWRYPTQSNTRPTDEAPPGTDLLNGSANCFLTNYVDPIYYTTEVGAYDAKPSDSFYGTFDQAGNLGEWNELDFYGDGSYRGIRGGSYCEGTLGHRAAFRATHGGPGGGYVAVGFRVAAVPEPATLCLLALGGLAVLPCRRGAGRGLG
jgi:formylglycine-generating enzyme required for sulfatase activity